MWKIVNKYQGHNFFQSIYKILKNTGCILLGGFICCRSLGGFGRKECSSCRQEVWLHQPLRLWWFRINRKVPLKKVSWIIARWDKHKKRKRLIISKPLNDVYNTKTWATINNKKWQRKHNYLERKSPLGAWLSASCEACSNGLSSRCKCSLAWAMQAFKCSFSEGSETSKYASSKSPSPAFQKPGAVYLVFNTVATRQTTE